MDKSVIGNFSENRQQGIDPRARIGAVCLESIRVETLADFYRERLGLNRLSRRNGTVVIGAGESALLRLQEVPEVRRPQRTSGLFHFAIRLPDRRALAGAVRRLLETGTAIEGFADHLVSEAVYLRDPEGNGIEMYCDRPQAEWFVAGRLHMDTLPLDGERLLSELPSPGDEDAAVPPLQSTMGHIHLRVSDLQATKRFYTQDLGFDLMMHLGSQAGFVSAGGYHHHVGFNTWAGPFSPRSEQDCGGMGYYTIVLPDRYELERTATRLRSRGVSLAAVPGALSFRDPSGIRVRLETE